MRIRIIIALVVLYCLPLVRTAYGQTLPFVHYSSKNGLAYTAVMCMIQDSRGFLWIGTQHGLSRFDGVTFENFYAGDGMSNDFVRDLCEDEKGNILIATNDGLSCYSPRGESEAFSVIKETAGKQILAVAADGKGNTWFATESGASKITGNNIVSYTKKDGLPDDYVKDILVDKNGAVWMGTQKGLVCFKENRFITFNTTGGDNSLSEDIRAITIDWKGNMWLGTAGGLLRFREGVLTSYSTKDGLFDNYVRTLAADERGGIWIGTNSGVSYYYEGTIANFNTKHGLLNDRIYAVFEDREGNTWFGTAMGLSKLNSLRIVNFSKKDGLPNNLVWTIIEDKKGNYWFGTDKGLSYYAHDTFTNFTTENGLVNNTIYALLEDKNGNIWVGTHGGLNLLSPGANPGKAMFKDYTWGDESRDNMILSLAEDGEGVIWVGTPNGISRIINGTVSPPGFKTEFISIHAFLKDRKGNLWFSHQNGICKIPVSGGEPVCYSTGDGLIGGKIFSMAEDAAGRLWIGTAEGLSCFADGEFTNYTTADGLSDNTCYFILEDDDRNLWIGTAKGVNRYDGTTFKTYTSRDGLASLGIVEGACLKDSRGHLWFGTVNGISKYDPKQDRPNTVPPPVYITNFTIFGREHGDFQANAESGNIELKYNQNYLRFDFTGISFTSPEDVSYKYRLEGIDRLWFETRNRYTSYPYLPPGDYCFEVTAVNNDGVESTKPAKIRFRILPPMWKTWWFILLAGCFALFITLMLALWRIRSANEKIALREKNKQLIMAQKMELLGILAGGAVHDLKNLLSIIIGYSKMAARHEKENQDNHGVNEKIKNTAVTALQVVKQILAFTRRQYDETLAANLPDLLDDIVEILKVTTPTEIKILWQPPGDEIRLFINPTKFQQVVMNLCFNAVHAMENGGELKIRLWEEEGNRGKSILLEVADTGCGMEQDVLDKIFDPLFTTKEPGKGTGLGLFVVKQIVDEYRGSIDVRSKPGEGTVFRISLHKVLS